MLNYEKHTLKNGARVLLAPNKNTEAVTLAALFGVGSRHESAALAGISHFLEHLFFKGTKRRPRPEIVSRELDAIGAVYNAFTSNEETGFWIKASAKDIDTMLNVLSDMLLNPLFNYKEIEKEKGVIEQEINMREDDPRRRVHGILEDLVFEGQPLGRDVIGTKETVRRMTRGDIVRHRKNFYIGGNTVLTVAGNFEINAVLAKIRKYFAAIPKNVPPKSAKTILKRKEPKVAISHKNVDQSHLALAFRTFSMHDKQKYALNVLAVVLGGSMSSRLFREIRGKRGLAYNVYTYPSYAKDGGYLGIFAGLHHDKLNEAMEAIIKILLSIKAKGLTAKEIKEAKSHIRGQLALQFETTDDVASYLGEEELSFGKITAPEETLRRIEKVTNRDILKVASGIFRAEKVSLAVITKPDNKKAEEKILLNIIKTI